MEFDNLKWPSIIDWPFSLFLPLLILIFSDATTKMLGRLRIDMLPNQQQGAAGDATPPLPPVLNYAYAAAQFVSKQSRVLTAFAPDQ